MSIMVKLVPSPGIVRRHTPYQGVLDTRCWRALLWALVQREFWRK